MGDSVDYDELDGELDDLVAEAEDTDGPDDEMDLGDEVGLDGDEDDSGEDEDEADAGEGDDAEGDDPPEKKTAKRPSLEDILKTDEGKKLRRKLERNFGEQLVRDVNRAVQRNDQQAIRALQKAPGGKRLLRLFQETVANKANETAESDIQIRTTHSQVEALQKSDPAKFAELMADPQWRTWYANASNYLSRKQQRSTAATGGDLDEVYEHLAAEVDDDLDEDVWEQLSAARDEFRDLPFNQAVAKLTSAFAKAVKGTTDSKAKRLAAPVAERSAEARKNAQRAKQAAAGAGRVPKGGNPSAGPGSAEEVVDALLKNPRSPAAMRRYEAVARENGWL